MQQYLDYGSICLAGDSLKGMEIPMAPSPTTNSLFGAVCGVAEDLTRGMSKAVSPSLNIQNHALATQMRPAPSFL